MKLFTIELDCAPGSPRPNELLPSVLEGTGVTIDPDETVSRFFGNWKWQVPDDQVEAYLVARDRVKARVTELYRRGLIRYGSW